MDQIAGMHAQMARISSPNGHETLSNNPCPYCGRNSIPTGGRSCLLNRATRRLLRRSIRSDPKMFSLAASYNRFRMVSM